MLKCNSCKNPVSATSIHCEWCGAKIVREIGALVVKATFYLASIFVVG